MAKFNLANISLFKQLDKAELALLEKFCLAKNYQANQYIFGQNKIQDRLIIIKSGQAELVSQIDDEQQTIALFNTNDFLGEMSLIDRQQKYEHDLRAKTDLETLEIHQRHWPSLIKQSNRLKDKIYKQTASILNQRLNHADNKLLALFAFSQFIGKENSLEKISEKLLNIILEIIPSQCAAIASYSHTTNKLHVYQNKNYPVWKNGQYYSIEHWPLLKNILRQQQSLIFQINDWPQSKQLLPGLVQNTNIIIPIRLPKKVLGFIILGNKHDQEEYSSNNQILLEALAMEFAAVIQQTHLNEYEEAASEVKHIFIEPRA